MRRLRDRSSVDIKAEGGQVGLDPGRYHILHSFHIGLLGQSSRMHKSSLGRDREAQDYSGLQQAIFLFQANRLIKGISVVCGCAATTPVVTTRR
jgi:hypothetical protein